MTRLLLAALPLMGCAAVTAPTPAPTTPAHWSPDALPLPLVLHPSLRNWQGVLELAAQRWNAAARQTVLLVLPPADIPTEELREYEGPVLVLPVFDSPQTVYWVDEATGRFMYAYIGVDPTIEAFDEALTAMVHELGHLLGLQHDDADSQPYSVMGDSLSPSRIQLYRIEPDDAETVRSRYGPGH